MNVRITLMAATLAALPLMLCGGAVAGNLMGGPAVQSSQDNASLMGQLMSQRGKSGLDNRHGYALANQHPGADGTTISRADHTFKGVRVFGSESVIVSGPHGSIVSESVADRRSALGGGDLSVAPAISAKAAIDAVVRAVAPGGTPIDPPAAELIIYPVMKEVRVAGAANKAEADLNATDLDSVVDGYQLAYLVHTRMVVGNKPVYHDTVVSAADASVLEQWSMLQTVVGVGNSQYNGAVPINTTLSGSTYSMIDASRGTGGTFGAMAITNANHGTTAGALYTNSSNTWATARTTSPAAAPPTPTARPPR